MPTLSNIKYELLKFNSSNDEHFYDALKVYKQSISHDQKTNSSEITYWIDNLNKFSIGELFFFGLLSNGTVIGYAEIAYIKSARILIIDYITLDAVYKSNSAFYSFYSLILNYFDNISLDYDYITKEILCRYNETHIHKENISLFELENFKVINCHYIQPQLEEKNIESDKDALLMLYQRASTNPQLKKDAYIYIVDVIYHYYYIWDSAFLSDTEKHKTLSKAEENKKIILESIKNDFINLNGYPFKYSSSSDNAVIPESSSPRLLRTALFSTVIIILLVIGILISMKKLDYELKTILTIGSSVFFLVIVLVCILDKKFVEILKKLPIISKIFELLK